MLPSSLRQSGGQHYNAETNFRAKSSLTGGGLRNRLVCVHQGELSWAMAVLQRAELEGMRGEEELKSWVFNICTISKLEFH